MPAINCAANVKHFSKGNDIEEINYGGTPDGPQALPNPAMTTYTMQVLHRLGFRWNETARDYVDMIFEMLSTLGYFKQ